MRWQQLITTFIECSTSRIERLNCFWICWISRTRSTFSVGFMPAAGSSSRSSLGLRGEAADDFEPALFAVGQALGRGVAETAEVENFEQFLDALRDRGFVARESAPSRTSDVERARSSR